MKNLFDSHCHLYDSKFNDNSCCSHEALIKEIEDSDLKYAVDIGTDIYTSRKVAEDVNRYSFCYGAVGYYPQDTGICPADLIESAFSGHAANNLSANGAPVLTEEILSEIIQLYKSNDKIVAIGEIGLDYHDEPYYPPKETQIYWFRRQLEEAVKTDAPVCIHSRDADAQTFDILSELALGKIPVLLHCFSGSAELAKEYVKKGAKISIAGPVTYKNARHSVNVAAAVDLKDLLIETDSPYLSPVPMRGKLNKPYYVQYVAKKIAEIKGISYEEVAETTLVNALSFYRIQE